MKNILNISTPEQDGGNPAARYSELYLCLAKLFGYPDKELMDAIAQGAVAKKLRFLLTQTTPEIVGQLNWAALRDCGESDDTLQLQYTSLFDVNNSGAPLCSLYGGEYIGARMKTMEDVIRFFHHFGLTMASAPRELPDHITCELEFMHYLSFNEVECLLEGEDPGAFRRAQRDFLARHLLRWIPRLQLKLEANNASQYLIELTKLLGHTIHVHSRHLESLVGKVIIKRNQNPDIIYSSLGAFSGDSYEIGH